MSFDILLQGFAGGQAAPGRPDAALQVLMPHFAAEPRDGYVCLQLADGEADAYGVGGSSLMVNHAAGEQIWDLIVTVAAAAVGSSCPSAAQCASLLTSMPTTFPMSCVPTSW
jgi:hypothetical protein